MSGNVATPLLRLADTANESTAMRFFVLQMLLKVQTMTLVEVQAVHGGGVGATPTVDVLPLVDQVDGAGNAIPHVTLYGRPCMRWAAGSNAIILDPQVGDIGVMAFASRNISSVLSSRQHGPPPTRRAFAYADGVYLGGLPNEAPDNYVQIDTDGTINAVSTQAINLTVGGKTLSIDSSGITLDGILWDTHSHSPGTYNVSGTAVTGEAGSPKSP